MNLNSPVVLINGLPLVQIELKRSGVAITEAFNQIERYRRQNFYTHLICDLKCILTPLFYIH
jgi:type I site-specific restriction-modification system R (restriction) subunit